MLPKVWLHFRLVSPDSPSLSFWVLPSLLCPSVVSSHPPAGLGPFLCLSRCPFLSSSSCTCLLHGYTHSHRTTLPPPQRVLHLHADFFQLCCLEFLESGALRTHAGRVARAPTQTHSQANSLKRGEADYAGPLQIQSAGYVITGARDGSTAR